MEPAVTGFILSTASSVLAGIIGDLIKGKAKAALKAEIEEAVSRKVDEKFRPSDPKPQEEIEQIVRRVLDEILLIAQKDTDLKVSPDQIELDRPVRKGIILPFGDRKEEKELNSRLERLNAIIAQRREELGLPPESDEEKNPEPTITHISERGEIPPGWKEVEKEAEENQPPKIPQDENLQVTKPGEPPDAASGWKKVGQSDRETRWQKKIKKAVRDIQIIRSGGEVTDEE